jgi:nitrogen PTS system EIIA component
MATIRDLLQDDCIIEEIGATSKQGVLREFAHMLKATGRIADEEELVRVLTERETLGSTGIGDGVAIPHARARNLPEMVVAFGRSPQGVEYQALDGKPVFLFFLLVTPDAMPGDHLKTLARISRILKNPALRSGLASAEDKRDIQRLIIEEDAKYPQPRSAARK